MPSTWRAVAVFDDRPDQLVYMGESSGSVRVAIPHAFEEVLDDEERLHCIAISLQGWHGNLHLGKWYHHSDLTVPGKSKLVRRRLCSSGETS